MHSKHRYKISICSVILSERESFRNYSETLPFGHTFSCKKVLLIRPNFFGLSVPVITGFHLYMGFSIIFPKILDAM